MSSARLAKRIWKTWLPDMRVGYSTTPTHTVPFGYSRRRVAYASKVQRTPQKGSSVLLLTWDWKGTMYYEVLPQNGTRSQLSFTPLSSISSRKLFTKSSRRPSVHFLHNNASPYSWKEPPKNREAGLGDRTPSLTSSWHDPLGLPPVPLHKGFLAKKCFTKFDDLKAVADILPYRSSQFWEKGALTCPVGGPLRWLTMVIKLLIDLHCMLNKEIKKKHWNHIVPGFSN